MNPTEMTLLQQLDITDREIEHRKALFQFTDRDAERLASCKEIILRNLDAIVDEFYFHQISMPEVASIIGDLDTMTRLRTAMRRYVVELFSGWYDATYVNSRLIVGATHKRLGVTPKLYMAAMRLLSSILNRVLADTLTKNGDGRAAREAQESLQKLLMFDAQLVFDTYISGMMTEVEQARRAAEAHAADLEREVTERTEQLRELALRDPLTGLYNQRAFHENLRRELAVAERTGRSLALVYIDLNGFKALNDSKGHQAGDALLAAVAEAMRDSMRGADLGYRYGGDEFCLLLPDSTAEEATHLCHRLIETFDAGETEGVTFSIGVAQPIHEFTTPDELVRNADAAMYRAKARAHADFRHHIEIAAPPRDNGRAAQAGQ